MSVTVFIQEGKKPALRPTIDWAGLRPKNGWNPKKHQTLKKPVGKASYK